MLKNNYLYSLNLFSITAYLFLYITNQYYSSEDLITIGFTDHLKYIKIYEAGYNSDNLEVTTQQGYRFLIPYLIGIFSDALKINNFFVLSSIIVFLINILIINTFNKIIIFLNVNKNFSLIIISALIFNAYMFRPSILNPFLFNDWIFTYGLLLITTHFVKKNKNYFFLGLVLCAITRQTAQLLNLIFVAVIIYNIFFTKKKINIYFFGILLNIFIFIFISIISSKIITSIDVDMYFNHLFGIFYFNYNLENFIFFILRFILTYLFEIILFIFLIINIKFYKSYFNFELIWVVLIGLCIWLQPFLAGPIVDYGNISRLTVISMPTILIAFLILFRNLTVKKFYTVTIIGFLIISSFHHNYTTFFNYFFDYKNIHFALMNIFLNLAILAILIKNNFEIKKNKQL